MVFSWIVRRRLGAVLTLAVGLFGSGATAQTRSDLETCQNSTDVPRMMAACTLIADATQLQGKIRSFALLKRGFGHFALGKLDAARADYSAAIEIDPDSYYAHHELGLTLRVQGDLEGALLELSKAIKLSANGSSYFERGRVLVKLGRSIEAIDDFSAAIDQGADKNTAYTKGGQISRPPLDRVTSNYVAARADALYLTGKPGDAVTDYDRATAASGPEGYNLIWSTLARRAAGRTDATTDLSRAIDAGKIVGWPGTIGRLVAGKLSAADALAAAKDNDQMCEARFYTGALLHGIKDDTKARAELSAARDICPKNFREYDGAVALLAQLKR